MNALAGQGAARLQWSTLTVAAVVVAVLIAAPVLSVFSNVFIGETGGIGVKLRAGEVDPLRFGAERGGKRLDERARA